MKEDPASKGSRLDALPLFTGDKSTTLSAVQEEMRVDTMEVETGAVRVQKLVREDIVPVSVRLRSKAVEVRRVLVNRPVDVREEPRQQGDTLIVPVYELVPIVTLQLTLKEEVHITTRSSEEERVEHVTVASEEIVVERRTGVNGDWLLDPSVED
jgi:stress response protein YsnF